MLHNVFLFTVTIVLLQVPHIPCTPPLESLSVAGRAHGGGVPAATPGRQLQLVARLQQEARAVHEVG